MKMPGSQWWNCEKETIASKVFSYVEGVEQAQVDLFERFAKLAYLYDPNDPSADLEFRGSSPEYKTSENVVASNIDTVYAAITAQEVRARFLTDGADWSDQRRARHLEWYAEGLDKLLGIDDVCKLAFRDAALKGTGLVKVTIDEFDRICVERVMIDDVIVDVAACKDGKPKQIHQRIFVSKDELKARFPDCEEAIDGATDSSGTRWAGYRDIDETEVVVVESWRLPIGRKGRRGYVPGRHSICVRGGALFCEEWHESGFPFARITWTERGSGWYGISLAERIAGHQRTLNKRAWQIDRQLDQLAVPTTYVRMADASLAVRSTNRAGSIVPIKADYPHTVIPPAVSGETYNDRNYQKSAAYEESGVSRLAASSMKPAGLDSGAALREYRDQTTQRFSPQEKKFERLKLDTILLALGRAKELGDDAPQIARRARYRWRKFDWADVDPGETAIQISAASNLSRTSAGRSQMVVEWASAGVISQDEARRLLRLPDLEQAISLYVAALEDIERCIDEILDGEILVPEPYQNLKMGVWRMQQAYLKAIADEAPEEILEGLRQWIVQAAYMMRRTSQDPAGMMGSDPAGAMSAPPQPGLPEQEAPGPMPAPML